MSLAGSRLSGGTVLISGASSGIGARLAKAVAAEGAAVVLAARRVERLECVKEEIAQGGGRAMAVQMDVTAEDSVAEAFASAEKAFGPITGAVANAGVNVPGRALDVPIADFDRLFAVNVRGVFLVAREAAKRMRAAGVAHKGRVILISSITAHMQATGTTPYSVSKAAVSHMGRMLAREWARKGPNVTVVSPGYIRSELAGDWFETEAGKNDINSWPRRRLLNDDALNSMLVYLLSDESGNVTGSEFIIDDGQSL